MNPLQVNRQIGETDNFDIRYVGDERWEVFHFGWHADRDAFMELCKEAGYELIPLRLHRNAESAMWKTKLSAVGKDKG